MNKQAFLFILLAVSMVVFFSTGAASAANNNITTIDVTHNNLTSNSTNSTVNLNSTTETSTNNSTNINKVNISPSTDSTGKNALPDPEVWNNGVGTDYSTIQDAINAAQSGDLIVLEPGTYDEDNFRITEDLTIEGEGGTVIIDAGNNGIIFTVYNGVTLYISNLVLEDGVNSYKDSDGGAVYINSGGTLYAMNCTFMGNTASYGGAIYNSAAAFTLLNCSFIRNSADNGNGGAICDEGDGKASEGSATPNILNDCIFTDNTAGSGGAVYDEDIPLTVENCEFTSNSAVYGGAICNIGYDPDVYDGIQIDVENCDFSDNTAPNGDGGAICDQYQNLFVTNSNFNDNSASDGGAIYNTGSDETDNTATIEFSRFNCGNTASSQGPDIWNYNHQTLNAQNDWWGSNNPDISSLTCGPDFTTTPWLVMTISANPTTISTNGNSTVTAYLTQNNQGEYPTGGCVPNGIPITFTSTLGTISSSTTVNGDANALYTSESQNGVATVTAELDSQSVNTQITIINANVYVSPTGNDNTGNGSQTNPYQTLKTALTNVYPSGNIYILDGTYTGTGNTNLTINMNLNIIGENLNKTIINADGIGSIFIIPSGFNVSMKNLTLTGGNSTNYGGAINNNGDLTMNNCKLTNNTAQHGGALYNYNLATINNSLFSNNHATYDGAIYNYAGSNLTINNTIFSANTATYDSGAIYNDVNSSLTINDSSFKDNIASGGPGGAINNYGNSNVTSSSFNSNNATTGSAIDNENNGIATVHFSEIVGNIGDTINNTGSMNATLNWWGSNQPNFNNLTSGTVTITPWIVLCINAIPTTVNLSGNSNITANLLYDSNGIYHNPIHGVVPYEGLANFATNKGSIKNTKFSDGQAYSTLTDLKMPGVVTVSSMVDEQTVNTTIIVNGTNITVGQLINAAYDVKIYYEHNHALPSNVTIGGHTVVSNPEFLELLVTATIDINQNNLTSLNITNVKSAPNPSGVYTSGNLYKSSYLNAATNIKTFINKNSRAPNYASTTLGNIPFSKLVYMYSKIINFYGLNDRLPNYVSI